MELQKKTFRNAVIYSALIMGVMLLASAYGWIAIPAGTQIATHWGIDGQPDGYMAKAPALLITPAIGLLLTGLFLLIARVEPRRQNLRLSARAYAAIWLSTLGLLAICHTFIIAIALGIKLNITTILPVGIGVLFIIIGNYFGKLRSNFFAGIRTPWTLSSDLAWDKTHRFAGKLWSRPYNGVNSGWSKEALPHAQRPRLSG